MIKKTKVETLSKESLRYDTQNNDSFIKFYSEAEIGQFLSKLKAFYFFKIKNNKISYLQDKENFNL